jgi:hypothetical protein
MDAQTGWDASGNFTGGASPLAPGDAGVPAPQGQVPFYLAPVNQQKIATVAAAHNTSPQRMVASVQKSLSSGTSPDQAQAELDAAHAKVTSMQMQNPDNSQEMPPGQDWLKPLLALVDSRTGSKLSASYQAPTTKADILAYQNKLGSAQQELLGRDPNSDLSQNAVKSTRAAIAAAVPGVDPKAVVPDGMSAEAIKNDAQIKAMLTGGFGMQGAQLKANAMGGRVEVMKGNQALAAGKEINDDPLIKQYTTISGKLQKGEGILAGTPSTQRLSEVAQDYSAALNNGQISSDFKLKSIDTSSLADHVNKAIAWATAHPDQPAPAEEVKYWREFGKNLTESNNRLTKQRADALLVGKKEALVNNPAALNSVNAVANQYQTGAYNGEGIVPAAPQFPTDVMNYAKTHNITPEQAAQIKKQRGG